MGIDRQISAPHKIDTPVPIDKKLGTVDYVHEMTPYTKVGTNTRVAQKNGASVFHCKYFENLHDRIAWKLVNFCSIVC